MKTALVLAIWLFATILDSQGTPAPDVVIVETLQTITGYHRLLPGTSADAKGRLRTRLLQVLVKDGGEWKIASYHNVDVKPGTSVPEPQ